MTQNINAFPELNIARTTATYWIKESKKRISKDKNTKDLLYKELRSNRALLSTEKSKVEFLKEVLRAERKSNVKKSKEIAIADAMYIFRKIIGIKELSLLSGLSESKFYTLRDLKPAHDFKQIRSNQLTATEQKTLFKIAQYKSLAHLSIKQLQLYAFRNNLLHCHYDTWRKYIKKFNLKYSRKEQPIKKKNLLHQASYPGQVWHIDLTYFKGQNTSYLYLQVIIDSYSRAVISWVVKNKRNSETTIANLKQATEKMSSKILISDAGSENTNSKVRCFLEKKNIRHIVAQKRTTFSNARIEAFFNTIKSRYINKHKAYKEEELNIIINKAILLYNNSPSTIFFGATPLEVLKNKDIHKSLPVEIKRKMKYAKAQRHKHYKKGVCRS